MATADVGALDEVFRDDDWRRVLVAAVITDDLSVATMAATAGVEPEVAVRVFDDAVAAGVIVGGAIDTAVANALTDELAPSQYSSLHAAAARHFASGGPDDLRRAITLARRAAGTISHVELLALSDAAARAEFDHGHWSEAAELFAEADALDPVRTSAIRARRMATWATAAERSGDPTTARTLRIRAFDVADTAGAGRVMIDIAVAYCVPPDWRSGDDVAMRLVSRAELHVDNDADRARLTAVRAMLSGRVPTNPAAATGEHVIAPPSAEQPLASPLGQRAAATSETAWVTQPSVAQPLAEQALLLATDTDDETELLAHLAWRTTHRAPRFLERRWEASQVAIELAHGLNQPDRLVLACGWGAADAIERADPAGLERMVTLARWVGEHSGIPKVVWYAHTLQAGRSLLSDNHDQAEAHKAAALEVGSVNNEPGTFSAEILFVAQIALERDDRDLLAALTVDEDHPVLASPLARTIHALAHATLGNHDVARRDLAVALRGIDPEASYLLLAVLASRAACLLDDESTMRTLIGHLAPWAGHIAVDSNAWWCAGPVSLALAELHHALGDDATARRQVAEAAFAAERLGDLRAVRRAQALWSAIGTGVRDEGQAASRIATLTDRERLVLKLLARGETNPAIAERLVYSLATVRRDTITIYRKLGVSGRVEATAIAIAEGLVGSKHEPSAGAGHPPTDGTRP